MIALRDLPQVGLRGEPRQDAGNLDWCPLRAASCCQNAPLGQPVDHPEPVGWQSAASTTPAQSLSL
jgi:hypothetical protein